MQALITTTFAVAEFEVEPLHPVGAGIVLGDAVDRGQATFHRTTTAARQAGARRAIMAE
jgi:hypothetical protein